MIMSYEETLEFLLERLPMFQRIGPAAFKKDLTNTLKLLDYLDNPHLQFKTLHIAGTNGKGSVSHILASLLRKQGYSVGIYTSPHYLDIRERIKVNGLLMEKEFMIDFVDKMKPLIDEIQPSYFELLVAMSFDYFRYSRIDWGVIEVGLGGRLDSTNVITPELSVITNISFDHQNLLGDTLEKIAFEKAGIIKSGIPAVIGERQAETQVVFQEKASLLDSPISFATDKYNAVMVNRTGISMEVSVQDHSSKELLRYTTDLTGMYQLKNLNTAYAAMKLLEEANHIQNGDTLFAEAVANLRTEWGFMGRMQILNTRPLAIADSAHNEAGLAHLLEEIKVYHAPQVHFVMGTVNDKDPIKVLSNMPKDGRYYFCKPNIPRGMEATKLFEKGQSVGLFGQSFSSVREAYQAAIDSAEQDDIIVICGSIFVVAELI